MAALDPFSLLIRVQRRWTESVIHYGGDSLLRWQKKKEEGGTLLLPGAPPRGEMRGSFERIYSLHNIY